MEERKQAAYRKGINVFLGLAALTIIEFFAAQYLPVTSSTLPMLGIGLVKSYLIVVYFMNIARLWREEGH